MIRESPAKAAATPKGAGGLCHARATPRSSDIGDRTLRGRRTALGQSSQEAKQISKQANNKS